MNIWQQIASGAERRTAVKARVAAGMRPGRAVRRAWPEGSDDEVSCAARALLGDVSISSDVQEFVAAYSACRSCMSHYGWRQWAFYTPAGVDIAVLRYQDEIVARALVFEGRFWATYGSRHADLRAWLLFSGFVQAPEWLDGASFAPVQVRAGDRVVRTRTVVTKLGEFDPLTAVEKKYDPCNRAKYDRIDAVALHPWGSYKEKVVLFGIVEVEEKAPVFEDWTPYVDSAMHNPGYRAVNQGAGA